MLSLWNPFLPVTSVKLSDKEISKRDLFDRVFEHTWNDFLGDFARPQLAGIEYAKTENGMAVNVELPGVKDSDLVVDMKDNIIHIKAERKTKSSSYSIEKSFSVPEGFDLNNVDAELADGILTLTLQALPKTESSSKKIEVKKPQALLTK